MTHDEMLKHLHDVRQAAHDQFPDQADRLAQLDGHLVTATMVIDHIHDEARRNG